MKIEPFKLERYFDKYEFSTQYLLSSSDCDGYSLEHVLDCASASEKKLWNDLKLGYTEARGHPLLRKTIAKQYTKISADDVLVLSPGEANFILMNVALEPGDHVVCMWPAYQSLYQVARSLGCTVSFWKPENDEWHYNPYDLEELIRKNTKMIIINFPHNPTGAYLTKAEADRLVTIARKHKVMIFSDEMYARLVHDTAKEIPSFSDLYENCISLWGMAKSFGLAGLRLGWLVTRNQVLLNRILGFKDYLTICNNSMSEVAAIIALNHQEKFIEPNLKKINQNIKAFGEFHSHHNELFHFTAPPAGSTAMIKLNIKESAMAYCERLVKETGIMLLPSETFEFGDKHARIGFGRANMAQVLSRWDQYIKSEKRKT
jgi:aspartate/methionine/tyrosine aminotransferase